MYSLYLMPCIYNNNSISFIHPSHPPPPPRKTSLCCQHFGKAQEPGCSRLKVPPRALGASSWPQDHSRGNATERGEPGTRRCGSWGSGKPPGSLQASRSQGTVLPPQQAWQEPGRALSLQPQAKLRVSGSHGAHHFPATQPLPAAPSPALLCLH